MQRGQALPQQVPLELPQQVPLEPPQRELPQQVPQQVQREPPQQVPQQVPPLRERVSRLGPAQPRRRAWHPPSWARRHRRRLRYRRM